MHLLPFGVLDVVQTPLKITQKVSMIPCAEENQKFGNKTLQKKKTLPGETILRWWPKEG
jgi:hypothetical protein